MPFQSRASGVGHSEWCDHCGWCDHIPATWVRSAERRLPPLGLQPSLAIGVGQSRAIRSSPFSFLRAPPRVRKLSVWGVGHIAALVARFIPCLPASCDGVGLVCRFSFALALGVGQFVASGEDEQPLAFMWRADFCRRKQSFRNAVAQAFQLASDLAISEIEMGWMPPFRSGIAMCHVCGVTATQKGKGHP